MPRAAAAVLLAALLAGCTGAAPEALAVQATVTLRFSSSLEAPVRAELSTRHGQGELLDERTLHVPAFGSATAVVPGTGPNPWHVTVRLANGTLLEPTLDVAAGRRGLTFYLFADRVDVAPG